jgi:hypothetical protein
LGALYAKPSIPRPHAPRRKPARVRDEFAGFDCGDERLNVRGRTVAAARFAQPGTSDRGACDGGAELAGVYRWMNNARTSPEAVLAAHRPALLARAAAEPALLVVGDTSACPYNTRHHTEDLGPLSGESSRGMFAHVTYVTTPARLPLGVLATTFLVRDPEEHGRRHDPARHRSPVEGRESGKWEDSLDAAAALRRDVGPGPAITAVFDREGDIVRLLHRAAQERADYALLVRAKNDRRTADGPRTFARLLAQPAACEYDLAVPAGPQRPARTARMALRFAPVRLAETRVRGPAGTEPVPECDVYAVITREIDPPAGVAPLDWRLYTTRTVTTADDARAAVRDYAARWDIELLFRTWKQELRTLDRQYRTVEALQTSLTMDLVLAFVIMQVAHLKRHRPDAPPTAVFDPVECDALRRYRGERGRSWPPTLAVMADAVAVLGGHAAKKKPAGPTVMARGIEKLAVITDTTLRLLGRRRG